MKRSVVAAVLSENSTQFLAIKRRDVPIWVLPGGGVEETENPDDAIIREVLEETGLNVSITRKVAEYKPINNLATLTYLYECSVLNGNLQTGSETKEIGFFEFRRLPKPFFYIHNDMLEDVLRQEPDLIIKQFNQVTYWSLIKYFFKHPLQVLRFACSKLGFPMNSK